MNAEVTNGAFSLDVPLSIGPNVINVHAASPANDGFADNTIVIQRQGMASGIVIAFDSPLDGAVFVAPATIPVKAQAKGPDGSILLGLKIRNDSPVGFQNGVGESGFAEYEWTGVPEGTYEIIASMTNENGVELAKSVTIRVDADPQDRPFMEIWNGFKGALQVGNKAAALEYVAFGSRDRYDRVFNDLMPAMAEVFASIYGMRRTSLDENVAEFFVNQIEDGTNLELGFFIYFVKDGDGIWRISTL